MDAFLQRVSVHLAQIGQGLPRNLFKRHEEDTQNKQGYTSTLVLPEKAVARRCLEAYFEHGNATCRYLPIDPTNKLLDKLYANDLKLAQDHASMAIILLVVATG